MNDMEQQLQAGSFLRIHRSFIINIDKIETFSYDEISLPRATLPMGRTYRDEVMTKLELE